MRVDSKFGWGRQWRGSGECRPEFFAEAAVRRKVTINFRAREKDGEKRKREKRKTERL
jgi:hypothetical protein